VEGRLNESTRALTHVLPVVWQSTRSGKRILFGEDVHRVVGRAPGFPGEMAPLVRSMDGCNPFPFPSLHKQFRKWSALQLCLVNSLYSANLLFNYSAVVAERHQSLNVQTHQ
jgi:hypothetical protein